MTYQEEIDAIKAWAWDEKVEASKRILELEALLEVQRQETYKAVEREHKVKKEHHDLLRVAVEFAHMLPIYKVAQDFLATPAAMAVLKEDEWCNKMAKLEDGCDVSAGHMPEALQQAKEER